MARVTEVETAMVGFPGEPLPHSLDAIRVLAVELQKATDSSPQLCAPLAVAGPTLAAALGGAEALGIQGPDRERLHISLRQELRELQSKLVRTTPAQPAKTSTGAGAHADELDVLLAWCSTPLVPTYSAGVQLALGLQQDAGEDLARGLAWALRLACHRAGVDLHRVAPVLAEVCIAVCTAGPEGVAEEDLAEALTAHPARRMSAGVLPGVKDLAEGFLVKHAVSFNGYAGA